MRKTALILSLCLSAALSVAAHAQTPVISLYNQSSNAISGSGISDFSWSLSFDANMQMHVIDIYETWSSNEMSFIEIDNLTHNSDFYIRKHVLNDTGVDWESFHHELLDPINSEFEDILDGVNTPEWTPLGYSNSNNIDGLSFADGSGIAKTSNKFSSFVTDQALDQRDFVEFYDGMISGSGLVEDRSDVMSFGIRDNGVFNNQSFLLASRVTASEGTVVPTIPEPGTKALLLTGLAGGIIAKRKRKR
ncbi:MAG: PEP-CTERM sorting domain-containing protein [Candidatus Eisenbacteria bacterium]|uniref:PEP-CTERM sorting domain-containing protein n=1 Tax=Eiseniibacteriota bacterium TaxID=2212470 RepID=A0A7Y2E932_UNCEI|nr:PEP-CTERM sorting domain-containing protein [Candidatus Eisenbacteria bacterium]